MKTFLEILLRMSAYGSIAVLLVLGLRFLLRKFPKKTVVLFWIVAAIRLVCPFNFETPVSLLNLAPQSIRSSLASDGMSDVQTTSEDGTLPGEEGISETTESGVLRYGQVSVMSDSEGTFGFEYITDSGDDPQETTEITITSDPAGSDSYIITENGTPAESPAPGIAFLVWIVGAAAVVLYVAVGFMRTNRLVARLFRRSGKYLESERISTPFVYGIFSPKICVPASLDVSEKDYMLLHEQIHVKNHDALIKAFAIVVLCLHWFNPLVWIAVRLCMSDLEMRCDEEVVDILGERIRKDYCLSIVNHAAADTNFRVFTTAFAKKSISRMEIKMRIKNLINYKKVSKLTTLTVLIAALTATLMLTSCAQSPAPEDTPEVETEVAASEENTAVKLSTEGTPAADQADLILQVNDEDIVSVTSEDGQRMLSITEKDSGEVKNYTLGTGADDPRIIEVIKEQGIGDDPSKVYISVADSNGNVVRYVQLEKEDGTSVLENIETNEIVSEGVLSYSVTIDPDQGETVVSSAPLSVWSADETISVGAEVNDDGNDSGSYHFTLEEVKSVDSDEKEIVIRYNRIFGDGVNEIEYAGGDKLITETCEGALFDSLDDFKAFYSYDNALKAIDGAYETGDPRVRVAAWSQFLNEDACSTDTFEDKNNCYVLTRKLDDGSTHFRLVYDRATHDITRLENVIPGAEG
ncbi:MAG: M56 family metallopeptidase [Lachnospiraceae bacterium]|nr:M56 family metallopeptidase [Lachnospiraceae bacterium]